MEYEILKEKIKNGQDLFVMGYAIKQISDDYMNWKDVDFEKYEKVIPKEMMGSLQEYNQAVLELRENNGSLNNKQIQDLEKLMKEYDQKLKSFL